jgi:transposase
VSRDRANGFAEAVSQVLPHATQVADRYHLIQNLRDHLQQFLDRKRTCLPFIEDTPVGQKETSPSPPQTEVSADLSNLIAPGRLKVIRRSKRLARYEQVIALYQEGISQREIARQLRMSRNTVQHSISSPGFPERAEGTGQRNPGTSKLDAYLPYLRDLWDAGGIVNLAQ